MNGERSDHRAVHQISVRNGESPQSELHVGVGDPLRDQTALPEIRHLVEIAARRHPKLLI